MNKYSVYVTFHYGVFVDVEAESADKAEELVRDMDNKDILDPDWRCDGDMVDCDVNDFQRMDVEALLEEEE